MFRLLPIVFFLVMPASDNDIVSAFMERMEARVERLSRIFGFDYEEAPGTVIPP